MCQGRVHCAEGPLDESDDLQEISENLYTISGHLPHSPRDPLPGSAHVDVKDIDVGSGASVNEPPCGRGPGQSRGPEPLSLEIVAKFRFFHLNVNGLDCHSDLLDTLLQLHDFPEYVIFTETHLTKAIELPQLTNYLVVSRCDRRNESASGGVILFARTDVWANIVSLHNSESLELCWHTLHADVGPILVGAWYRPPNRGEVLSIQQFDRELEQLGSDFVGKVILGDMNVHNLDWLRFSYQNSREGKELEKVCISHGLSQCVKGPTRGDYLLDLALCDFASQISCDIVPGILEKDHRAVIVTVDISIPSSTPASRECFDFGKANWKALQSNFSEVDWATFFEGLDADDAAFRLTEFILDSARRFIPTKTVRDKPYKHPWINERCRELLRRKQLAIGTPEFMVARDACTAGFAAAYGDFIRETRSKLLKADAKDWWKISKQLLSKNVLRENIPALRSEASWSKSPSDKAATLSETFASKAGLPDEVENDFSQVIPAAVSLRGFLRIRQRTVYKILRDLDASSGTGPDGLPTKILKQCASQLSLPVTLLSRLCLSQGRWPLCWRTHWIHPLHKRNSRADAANYRGVHLTAQLSKAVERAVGSVFVPWLAKHGFGEHQYAYTRQRSHRDVLAINVCNWLLLLEAGFSVGLFCSDVSGAFDRVRRQRLCDKLAASGLPSGVVKFLASWLEDRISNVIVAGALSPDTVLADSVFQGTVLGPPLWNLFYADACRATRPYFFTETVFADDYNCWTIFEKGVDEAMFRMKMKACQLSLHDWGKANQVTFDPSKESFHLIHRQRPIGPAFKLLGLVFDGKLLMHEGIRKIAVDAGWRLQSILRPRRYFSTPELMKLYKSLVLSFVESSSAGYFHAADSVLAAIDRVQARFLRAVGLSEVEALCEYRLAPLKIRREIGILGMLHRVNLGQASRQMLELFPPIGERAGLNSSTRSLGTFHNRQLHDRISNYSSTQLRRSILGMVQCYNALPQHFVNAKSVKLLQRQLQVAVAARAWDGYVGWQSIFSIGCQYAKVYRFQSFFQV